MAVYKRNYRPYSGPLTTSSRRFLVVTRYSFAELFSIRFFGSVLVTCFFPALVMAFFVYLAHSETVQALLNFQNANLVAINSQFFIRLLQIEGWFALLLVAWVGPSLVSSDLANNALPLFLSRPLSRAQYVAGKMTVFFVLLSSFTWVPGLLIFALQAGLDKGHWVRDNWWIAPAFLSGALIWIALLSLLALALSAWVKWKVLGSLALMAAFFVPAGMGEVFNVVTRMRWGRLLNPGYLITVIWNDLFRDALHFHAASWENIPVPMAWASLLSMCLLCVWVLNRRLRAREVVRG